MVFENLVGYLLDKYLGDYIENLDTKKLKIDLWSGNVVLENLYLKPNALADLNLPVTISLGYLQKLTLQVPWKNLYTHPTKATIDGLYLLVVPKTEVEYDAARDEKEQHDVKMREVQKIEELRKEREALKNTAETSKNNDTFVERMQLQVIRNLELSIENIHIVYEDRSTKPDHPFAFGITLNYIKLHTTTPDWKPTILKEDTPLIHKLGELSGLSIYWNTDAKSRSGLPRDTVVADLQKQIAVNSLKAPTDISYILRPLNITARVILVMKPGQEEYSKPMFDIKVDLDDISLNLTRDQYLDILDLMEFQDYLSAKSKYIKYQIRSTELKATRKNWQFAYNAIVSEEVRPRRDCYKWENIKAHLDRCREYRSIHFQELTGKLTAEQKQRAEELEKKLDVFNLTYIRRKAEIEAKKKKDQEPKGLWGNVSSWWSGSKPKDEPDLDLEKVMSEDEKQKLYDAIGYGGADTSTTSYPPTYIDIDCAIRLNLLDVNVWSKIDSNDTKNRIVTRAAIPNTVLAFQRRPANDAIAVVVDMGSFQVFGIATTSTENEITNTSRPVLVQPVSRSTSATEQKLLHIEFETNPLNLEADYRVKVQSQSLEIKYDAPTINKLQSCFEQDTQRNLQGVKQVAYSTYSDVKHRSYILMKHNVEKIKRLDIDVDIQSSYLILTQNGIYQDGAPSLCLDLGHLTVQRKSEPTKAGETTPSIREATSIEEARELSYTEFQLKLEDIQLIYASQDETWQMARIEKKSRLHLIEPMGLELDLGKCIYSDDDVLPAWKVAGKIPNIAIRLSDQRLFQLMNLLKSIPFPESSAPATEIPVLPTETTLSDPEQTLQAVEGMTPVVKTKEKVEAEEKENTQSEEKPAEAQKQLTQLEATFRLDEFDLQIREATADGKDDARFLRLKFQTIIANTKIRTFDMEFDASLTDFIVYHEQFVGKDGQYLRLLSAEVVEAEGEENQKLVDIKFLHTSAENPSFALAPYFNTENHANININKLIVTLQLEALLSIFKFQDTIMKKLPQEPVDEQAKKKQEEEEAAAKKQKEEEENKKVVKKNDAPASPSLKANAVLEEFRIVLATQQTKIFDIQVQGVKADVTQASDKMLVSLALTDLRVIDPYKQARYRKIISQQGNDNELLRVDLSLYTYAANYQKPIDVYDCDVKVNFAKANIVFLFKHINALLGFLNTLNITKAALDVASTQADAALEQAKKLQEQAFKVHLDIEINAPNIIVPTNSYSDEALYLDLGKLTMKTDFHDDPEKSLVERQNISLQEILARRVKLNEDYEILGEADLLECGDLKTEINRLLFPNRTTKYAAVEIKLDWDLVHFKLTKDDYTCVMRILTENMSENVQNQIPDSDQLEQYHYEKAEQEKKEEELKNAVIKRQQEESQNAGVSQALKFRAEIKTLALTLYLGESDLSVLHVPRNDHLKLASVQISSLEAVFRQQSDGYYKAVARVKNFLLDDLRASNKADSVTRMMDRHFNVDPDAQMLVASFEFTPPAKDARGSRKLTARLESLYICISLDYLMTLQDFFVSGLPTPTDPASLTTSQAIESDKTKSKVDNAPASQAKAPAAKPATPPAAPEDDVETRIEVAIQNPQVILLEDQHNSNSNCLVLDLRLNLGMAIVNNITQMNGTLDNLTVYSSNFAELKNAHDSDSKVKYRILQPAKADFYMQMSNEAQKISLNVSDIVVSIAPAAIRTMIGVTNSLGTLQTTTTQEIEKINSKSIFNARPFKDAHFWFTKDLKDTDILESVRGMPSDQKAVKEEEAKAQEKEVQAQQQPPPPMIQQLLLSLDTIELKLEVGLGSVTKAVVAMCLSSLTADVRNWSSEMTLNSTVNIEAALYNETILSWEPLIEPTIDGSGRPLAPWGLSCSILPVLPGPEKSGSSVINEQERKEGVPSSATKQIISVRADQLLNVTITKTGLDLLQRLSALINDVYNKRLPPSDDDDLPMLSLSNGTGSEITIDRLEGLEFVSDKAQKSATIQPNDSVPLTVPSYEHGRTGRLSVIEEQSNKKRQDFAVKIGGVVKPVSINRTWKRVYTLSGTPNAPDAVYMQCDTLMENDRRRVILSSIVRVFNNTLVPIVVLNVDSVDPRKHQRVMKIDVNKDIYLPVDLVHGNAKALFFSTDDVEEENNFFSFNWDKDFANDDKLIISNNRQAHFVVFKEVIYAYSENTDQLDRLTFNLYIHPALHITNLLPVDIQCSFDNHETVDLKPSQLQLVTSGHKKSLVTFTIPSYNHLKWISDPVNLQNDGLGDHNEYPVVFHKFDEPNYPQTLRMALRVGTFHDSYRLLLYSPYWVLNRTDVQLEFQVESTKAVIDVTETPYLICPEKFEIESAKKGLIRVVTSEQANASSEWSEKFSLDVIQSTGMTSCKIANDRIYMVCVNIATSSFGLTKLVTLSPSMLVSNKSSIAIEIVEIVREQEQDSWKQLEPEQLIPFWPRNIKEGMMRVRYGHNQTASVPFLTKQKHRTLLRMKDDERPAIYVEVTATDFDGVRVIFSDYKIGDAPIMVVNCLRTEPISFGQVDVVGTEILPPLNYLYYTWRDPLQKRELAISCGSKSATTDLNPRCGSFGKDNNRPVNYAVFVDGVQTVLLFSDDVHIIESASGVPSLAESMNQRIEIGIRDIGLSIVNDLKREEMLYISLTQSKVVWTEAKKSRVKPLAREIDTQLEELYLKHLEQRELKPGDKNLAKQKYQSSPLKDIIFVDDNAEYTSGKGNRKVAKRQALDGFWVEYAWSATNTAIHLRINSLQIDNQLEYTIFPVMLHPIVPKATATEYTYKPFIELSIFETKTAKSNIMQFKYFKLLIQEFAVKIDQGFIVAVLAFLKAETISTAPTISMDADLEQIKKPLAEIIKAQIDTQTGETEMFFNNIHLSPLKIHVSFSMHGAKLTEELLAEYAFVGFLLQTLNVAEVQDVILRLGYYERNNDKFTMTKIGNEVSSHYQNQFMKQLHVLVLGLDVLGNPFGVIRGLAEGVESFFYEPYKGAIEGPAEFAEGLATGARTLFGSAVGGAAGAVSKITGVLGKSLATLTFDEDYKASRIRRKEPGGTATTQIAKGGKDVVMGFVDGLTGVVTKPISGAKSGGVTGFAKGLGKGFIGLVARPTGGIVDFASTSMDLVKRTAQQEEVVRRVRYPRHVGRDGLVRPYMAHEAMGFYILNRLEEGKYTKSDTYVAHITCQDNPSSWLMATSNRILFITQMSLLDLYEVDWDIEYKELRDAPTIKADTNQIQILTKSKIKSTLLSQTIKKASSSVVEDIDYEPKKSGTMKSERTYGKLIKYRHSVDAKYIIEKIVQAKRLAGF